MRVVPYSELDSLMEEFREGYKVSYDEAYRRFRDVSLAPPDDLPSDPLSPEYADRIMDLYKLISGRKEYGVQNERSEFNVDERTYRPFPFYTKNLSLASTHFTLIGQLFAMMDVPAGSDILEFGFGWGHTTLSLAMLGYSVTAVDIEDCFCELVRRRAEMFKVDVDIVNSDFLWVETTDKKFDAVVFFECFHHCWEFQRLLKSLHRVMKPGGKIYFGAEPINEQFTIPWGTRLDGEALFVARSGGWMELGFHSNFFADLLSHTGWRGRCISPHFWFATSAAEAVEPIVMQGDDTRLGTVIGTKGDGAIKVAYDAAPDARGYALYGPYLPLTAGTYDVTIELDPGASAVENAHVDAVAESGTLDLGGRTVAASEIAAGTIRHTVELKRLAYGAEIRLLVPGGFAGAIRRVTIVERAQG
jgi:2-polyprenyl-3-methyl-5-hydroxy-6-metoxy-1,4-benzoquinol methylase